MAAGPGAAGTARVSSGRDLNCVPEVAGALGAVARQGFDFLCLPLFHPRHRREFSAPPARDRPGPQTRSDLVLAGRDWNTLIVGKLSPWIRPDSPLEHVRKNSQKALRQELDFGAYLGLAAHLVPLRGPHNPNLARGLSAHLHSGHHATQFWVQVPLVPPEESRDDVIGNEAPPPSGDEENTWEWWHNFRTLLDYNKRVALALELGPDLPSPAALARWLGEPVRAAFLPTRLFLTNKKGFPVLGRGHQRLLGQLLKLDVQIIVQGAPRHGGRPLAAYLQYLEHLGQHRPPPSAYELYARGYEDYLQSPLQPLMDNLESQTYEVFEKDPIKYCQYQQAIFKCLTDRVPEEERETNVQVVMVLGAGRGPLVAAALRAARQAGARLRLYAVEKNPNAVVTLENCQWEEWGSQVAVVARDMRGWAAPEAADLVVSELLGSFGDNELSPECLDGARGCLKEDGVSIPQSYTSFLAPVSSSKLYNEVRGCREHDRHPEAQFETPYVVRLHNFHQVAPPQPCFTFQHPNPDPCPDNSRYTELSWRVEVGTVLHGFAGYFETRLYGDVTLSIRPETHSPGLFSWFPIFFPIKQPVPVRAGQEVSVAFWRVATPTKVWYEWAVTAPACSALHNPTGRSYTIGL
uniref:Protein arginine N-methyltransferase 5 n=1 Tax=Taeniopygia guttata TaxID=59729 RepID=A0A674H3Z3_TAEGU|nr:protein arginine N-methyltransferase 5 isoform X1 [Taeniopygia guttata]XP_041568805.1 protein arginine N-methyltransferase 5 isoform X2 [Taeniopygia guttata]XP_041568806.1 protein arginine N-methyltransferase 5 isoform X3 [Taeniopygia guttata]XP_041568807.1 protein arginine N-methyltransferase 5 isoform X4 [Taeniopygia guttata]XP_041568808.1 protein arginine N-methyltransferase 5 isoform X5 [Taeniopygia guttata]